MTQIFVDLDGVLADFDSGYRAQIGAYQGKEADDADWGKVRATPDFYLNLPPMPDFDVLWSFLAPFKPIILTGVPSNIAEAAGNKRAWVDKYAGYDVRMIACKSKDKCLHGRPGDILIDDWEKYMHLWIGMGGRWLTHTSAEHTIAQLKVFLLGEKPAAGTQ